MTLAEFVLDRIADEEAGTRSGTIRNGVFSGIMQHYGMDEADMDDQSEAGEITDAIMAHIGPRVLAECEAKRRIVELHMDLGDAICGECWDDKPNSWPCATLRFLALPYADHPSFEEEWRV